MAEYSSIGRAARVHFLDEMRGVCILLMVLYHAFYDIVYIFGHDIPLYRSFGVQDVFQPMLAGSFIIISGISCRYSRGNLKRGLVTLAIGLAMTAVTAYYMPGQIVMFGILHLLGSCMIIFGLTHGSGHRRDLFPAFWSLLLSSLLFAFTYFVPRGILGIPPDASVPLPGLLFSTGFLFPLGLPGAGFASSDYFPLVPWMFLFMAGASLGMFFIRRDMPAFFYRPRCRWLSAVGRRTLLIYIIHQPLLYGLFTLVFRLWPRIVGG